MRHKKRNLPDVSGLYLCKLRKHFLQIIKPAEIDRIFVHHCPDLSVIIAVNTANLFLLFPPDFPFLFLQTFSFLFEYCHFFLCKAFSRFVFLSLKPSAKLLGYTVDTYIFRIVFQRILQPAFVFQKLCKLLGTVLSVFFLKKISYRDRIIKHLSGHFPVDALFRFHSVT